MKKYVSDGHTVTVTAPAGGVTSDVPVLIGTNLFGVPVASAAVGETFGLKVNGIYEDMPKDTAAAWAEGDLLYWDNTAKKFTKTTAGNTKAAVAVAAALIGDTVGVVKIGPTVG
jgi:predicted RecA/RadA family phage recombinase